MSKVPTFRTSRLILREITEVDLDSCFLNFNDYEIVKHFPATIPWPYKKENLMAFIKNVVFPQLGINRWFWGIFLKENPSEVIGVVDIWRVPTPENRGFWLARKHWGRGLMTEAIRPTNDYAFNVLKFDKLILSNAIGNDASRRIKEKSGAVLISTRPIKLLSPEFKEAETWELTKENWFKSSRLSEKQIS